ncbi:arylesterase [Arsenicitalea aurantiaca]|uniref:Arylesterase n=1 Tax=Arsenicitalea aurantiaca TaxID=1783274 RepID=A0A433XLB5_9HYPH|nr:arylesterase [Arsenicitalea aurantiaca]RUT34851.1 arylesterase [Arsenicitalea aurantiaca]
MIVHTRHHGVSATGARHRPAIKALYLIALLCLINFAWTGIVRAQTIVVYGDSLVAGYGLSAADGFVPQLQRALDAEGLDVNLVNAGVSGDTSQDGLARLDWTLADRPDAVMLGLGANDMLRGIDPAITERNLTAILDRLAEENIPVLLFGMMANRGLGPDYVAAFDAIYPRLAEEYGARLVPFFLDGVAFERTLNQPDGIHPNAEGVARIVAAVLPEVRALVSAVR